MPGQYNKYFNDFCPFHLDDNGFETLLSYAREFFVSASIYHKNKCDSIVNLFFAKAIKVIKKFKSVPKLCFFQK